MPTRLGCALSAGTSCGTTMVRKLPSGWRRTSVHLCGFDPQYHYGPLRPGTTEPAVRPSLHVRLAALLRQTVETAPDADDLPSPRVRPVAPPRIPLEEENDRGQRDCLCGFGSQHHYSAYRAGVTGAEAGRLCGSTPQHHYGWVAQMAIMPAARLSL